MNAALPNTPVCPKCGRKLDAYAPEGECPRCMLVAATAGDPPVETTAEDPLTPALSHPMGEGARRAGEGREGKYFGDYELLEEIGRGGMGVVHKARQLSLGRIVAIKLLPFNATTNPESVKRFRAEASAAASLLHPNIVAIHEVGVHQGQHYFAMDLIEGQNLAQLVAGGPLPAKRAARYLKTIAEAIDYAHQRGILHRDLKPSNVLLDASNQPRVTDFGLARRLDGDSSLTLSGQVVGSPSYMPPEQAGTKGSKVSRRSDVYALGAMLYHLVSGRAPFVGDTVAAILQQVQSDEPVSPRLLNPSVPRDLATICLKCLEKEPAKRYPTAQALAEELGRFLNDEPIVARPVSRTERAWRSCRRHPAVTSLAIAVLMILFGGITAITWQWRRAEQANDQLAIALTQMHLERMRGERASRPREIALRGAVSTVWPSRDGRQELRFSEAEGARVYDSAKGVPITPPFELNAPIHLADFSLDGSKLFTLSRDPYARLWDARTGRLLTRPLPHDGPVSFAQFSLDGNTLVTLSEGQPAGRAARGLVVARIWDVDANVALTPPLKNDETSLLYASFTDDGKHLVTISEKGTVAVWDARTGRRLSIHAPPTAPFLRAPNARVGVRG